MHQEKDTHRGTITVQLEISNMHVKSFKYKQSDCHVLSKSAKSPFT